MVGETIVYIFDTQDKPKESPRLGTSLVGLELGLAVDGAGIGI